MKRRFKAQQCIFEASTSTLRCSMCTRQGWKEAWKCNRCVRTIGRTSVFAQAHDVDVFVSCTTSIVKPGFRSYDFSGGLLKMALGCSDRKLQELLCDEAGFLVDNKVQRLLSTVPKEQGEMMKVHNIMKVLGVVDGQTFDSLVSAISSDGAVAADAVKVALVHPNDVVVRLKVCA